MLSPNDDYIVIFSAAAMTKADQLHQPRTHLVQHLLPRHTRSFFLRREKPRRRTGRPGPPGPNGDESPANCVPHSGRAPSRLWRVENTARYSSGTGSGATCGRPSVHGADAPDNNDKPRHHLPASPLPARLLPKTVLHAPRLQADRPSSSPDACGASGHRPPSRNRDAISPLSGRPRVSTRWRPQACPPPQAPHIAREPNPHPRCQKRCARS